MAKKELLGIIKLQIPAGAANPSPPVGPALGQKGLNIMDFCKQFNEATKEFEKNMPIPVEITAYKDKSFTFFTKTPPASFLILKQAKLKKGSGETGKKTLKEMKKADFAEIAKIKQKDLDLPIESIVNMLVGTARSMGIRVVDA